MRACLPDWPAERIETLYNRIDVEAVQAEQVSREVARDHLALPRGCRVVGNVGRLHPTRTTTLIRGFAWHCRNCRQAVCWRSWAAAALEAQLKALAAELGVSEVVCFLGQVPNGRRYFKAFDVLL